MTPLQRFFLLAWPPSKLGHSSRRHWRISWIVLQAHPLDRPASHRSACSWPSPGRSLWLSLHCALPHALLAMARNISAFLQNAWACSYSRPFESVAAQPSQPARRPPRPTTSLACRAGAGHLKIAMHSQVRVGAPCMRHVNCYDVGQLDHQRHSGKPNTAGTSWRLPLHCFVSCVSITALHCTHVTTRAHLT